MADHLAALRHAMATAGIDAVLVAAPASASAIIGHRRVAVHGPSGPLPIAIVPREDSSPPVALTPDPDGAPDRAAVILHGIAWNPATLIGTVRDTLGAAATGRIAIDVASPGAIAMLHAALPDADLVDATAVITEALLAKGERELAGLGRACVVAHDAAFAAAGATTAPLEAAVARLDGAFPIADLVAEPQRVVVEIVLDGFAGVARIGPGDAGAIAGAVGLLGESIGQSFGELAQHLPEGVEIGGLGRGHELPRLRRAHALPAEVALAVGAVLVVSSGAAAVTVAVEGSGPRLLSPPPHEVVR